MGQSTEQLRHEIESTRSNMSRDLDAIGDKVSPRRIAQRRKDRMGQWFSSVREQVFGAAEDASGQLGGGAHSVASSVGEHAHGMADALTGAPHTVARKTQGSPVTAGAVAFGVGFLASLIGPSTAAEQEAVRRIEDEAGPMLEPLKDAAHELVATIRSEGAEAAEGLKADAGEHAQTVRDTARGTVADARQQLPR